MIRETHNLRTENEQHCNHSSDGKEAEPSKGSQNGRLKLVDVFLGELIRFVQAICKGAGHLVEITKLPASERRPRAGAQNVGRGLNLSSVSKEGIHYQENQNEWRQDEEDEAGPEKSTLQRGCELIMMSSIEVFWMKSAVFIKGLIKKRE